MGTGLLFSGRTMMLVNVQIDALIARIEGGEALTREFDREITGITSDLAWPLLKHFTSSFDAIMSLARNMKEAEHILNDGWDTCGNGAALDPFHSEPVLRAMLGAALRMRRT